MEVFELASPLGMAARRVTMPIVLEELAGRLAGGTAQRAEPGLAGKVAARDGRRQRHRRRRLPPARRGGCKVVVVDAVRGAGGGRRGRPRRVARRRPPTSPPRRAWRPTRAAAVERFGRIDLYHLNAGIGGSRSPFPDIEIDDFDRVMDVNVRGVFLGLRAAFRQFEAAGERWGDRHDGVDLLVRRRRRSRPLPREQARDRRAHAVGGGLRRPARRSASTRSRRASSRRTCSASRRDDQGGPSGDVGAGAARADAARGHPRRGCRCSSPSCSATTPRSSPAASTPSTAAPAP